MPLTDSVLRGGSIFSSLLVTLLVSLRKKKEELVSQLFIILTVIPFKHTAPEALLETEPSRT